VEFEDGTACEIVLNARLLGSVFEPVKDDREFQKAAINDFGAIAWPCGADLAPDAFYQRLKKEVSV
jgi:hypothetical protein